ncbi:hypothetical protein K8I85_16985, partial [bacterium]|nr:hypothetical protein [bacterium]
MTTKTFTIALLAAVALAAVALGACARDDANGKTDEPATAAAAAGFCAEHQIDEAQCPWCHPELIESLGWCKGHE